jgi:hypothetical protein
VKTGKTGGYVIIAYFFRCPYAGFLVGYYLSKILVGYEKVQNGFFTNPLFTNPLILNLKFEKGRAW